MDSSLDAVWMVAVDDLGSWVRERERLLVEQENELFRAARERATTDQERVYWDEFIELRQRHLAGQREAHIRR